MGRLHRLTKAAAGLAEDAPAVLGHPEAARGLEQALIGAMVDCLSSAGPNEDRTTLRQHAAIMRRFHEAIERHGNEPLYVPEVCEEIGASERTLRTCCQEHLGTGPKHFLLLRRMNSKRCSDRTFCMAMVSTMICRFREIDLCVISKLHSNLTRPWGSAALR